MVQLMFSGYNTNISLYLTQHKQCRESEEWKQEGEEESISEHIHPLPSDSLPPSLTA